MTVDPRLQLTPGEYLIHPDGSASRVVGKRNMTVDEILATGQYTDRRGRGWFVVGQDSNLGPAWVYNEEPFGVQALIGTHQMRLLIERDQHECIGLRLCRSHPVPNVLALQDDISGAKWGHGFGVYRPGTGDDREAWLDTLPEVMDAARALSVGE